VDIVDTRIDETNPIVSCIRHPYPDIASRQPFTPSDEKHLAEKKLQHAGYHGADRQEHKTISCACIAFQSRASSALKNAACQ